MTDKPVQLLAAVYPNEEHAKTTIDMLHEMHRAANIDLVDSAMITKNDDGKIKTKLPSVTCYQPKPTPRPTPKPTAPPTPTAEPTAPPPTGEPTQEPPPPS